MLDRVHWIVSVRNRADIAMHDVTSTVHFAGGAVLHGAAIDRVEPGAVGRSLVTGAIGLDESAEPHAYRLGLARACW